MFCVTSVACLAAMEFWAFIGGGGLGIGELLLIGVIAVILFGKNLPDVARSMGRSYNQFRRGLQDIQSDVYTGTYTNDYASTSTTNVSTTNVKSVDPSVDDQDVPTAPKFELPTSAPQESQVSVDEKPAN